ncbi:LAMI_0E16094g1_1 [Lachancea mirantina]|uniref:LAMI_0E16094g1_1 n=1 Tax=Lachancea mirantina TaxID=1230905 RepID=A0A1G4JST4_9SACH|nr:LAMI_0E16094g1_1 [Lachancea mirantina]
MERGSSSSFDSILAGVQRLREQNGAGEVEERPKPAESDSIKGRDFGIRAQQKSGFQKKPPINAFNQQREQGLNTFGDSNAKKRKSGGYGTGKTVLVSSSQRGNPLLNSLTNTNWRYVTAAAGTKIFYDYCVHGRNVLFLSLKYHRLHPEYIAKKMQPLVKNGNNILLCVVDIESSESILQNLSKACMFGGFALLLAFNFEQAAKYLIFLNQ